MTDLLTRHFLRRFFDNDLLSADADQHEVIAVGYAALASPSLFLTVFLSVKYLFGIQLPGPTAITALDDRFLYVAGSMIITALVAVAEWEALSLDARDTSILGPLPISRSAIVRAKLAAVMLFGVGFAVALNLIPAVVYPGLLVAKLPVGLFDVLRLIAVHAVATMAAGAFGFLAVLAVRGVLYGVLGDALFARVSAAVQGLLVVGLVSALFLLPGFASNVSGTWLLPETSARWVPPMWFVGLYEAGGGDVVANAQDIPLDPNAPAASRMLAFNRRTTDTYNSNRAWFRELAGLAVLATALAAIVAFTASLWNMRRLPAPSAVRRTRRPMRAAFAAVSRTCIVRHPIARAGFFFTLHALARSTPHRLAMAASAAIGLAAAVVTLGGLDIRQAASASSPDTALLAVQFVIVSALVVGFRHAVGVPADLGANWIFQLAWPGEERRYVSGVKRAAAVGVVLPALAALFPIYAWSLGPRLALAHAAAGLLAALTLMELLFLGFRRLAFASSYVPNGNLKTPLAPLALVTFAAVTYGLAWTERLALASSRGTMMFLAALALVFAAARLADLRRRRHRRPMEFEELPDPATQRLGLTGQL